MKNKIFKISWVTLGSMLVLMAIGGLLAKAEDTTYSEKEAGYYTNKFCFDGKVAKMNSTDLIRTYTTATNNFINANLQKMMSSPKENWPAPDLSKYNSASIKLCGSESAAAPVDLSCRAISLCLSTADPSAYCVGAIALGFTPEKYAQLASKYSSFTSLIKDQQQLKTSYFCFKAALETKKEDISDGTVLGIFQKCDLDSDFKTANNICKLRDQWLKETSPELKSNLGQQILKAFTSASSSSITAQEITDALNGTMSIEKTVAKTADRLDFVAKETGRAKQALDQTLAAYGQVRMAWQIHVKYLNVFSSLVIYRDKLVDIRKQIENFPGKFVDATTTRCL